MIEIFNTHRKTLFGIAYRMLGKVTEAEDLVQETWLRWQKQNPATIESPKAWLVSTMTRLCIDQLRSARHQREEYYGIWLPEPLATSEDPRPDEAAGLSDSLTMAFMLMLESLDPVERAAFLLREVFSYDYAETAEIVGKSEANCRQIVHRARTQLQARPSSPLPPTEQAHRLVEQFLAAARTGQVQNVLELLTEDAALLSDGGGQVRAAGRPILSADHVSRFIAGVWHRLPPETQIEFALINGRPGFFTRTGSAISRACSFEFEGTLIRRIYLVLNPEKLRHLALSPEGRT